MGRLEHPSDAGRRRFGRARYGGAMPLQVQHHGSHTQIVVFQRPRSTLLRTRPLHRVIRWLEQLREAVEQRYEGSVLDSLTWTLSSNVLVQGVQGVAVLVLGLIHLVLILSWALLLLPLHLLGFVTETLPSWISKKARGSDLTLPLDLMTLSVRGMSPTDIHPDLTEAYGQALARVGLQCAETSGLMARFDAFSTQCVGDAPDDFLPEGQQREGQDCHRGLLDDPICAYALMDSWAARR